MTIALILAALFKLLNDAETKFLASMRNMSKAYYDKPVQYIPPLPRANGSNPYNICDLSLNYHPDKYKQDPETYKFVCDFMENRNLRIKYRQLLLWIYTIHTIHVEFQRLCGGVFNEENFKKFIEHINTKDNTKDDIVFNTDLCDNYYWLFYHTIDWEKIITATQDVSTQGVATQDVSTQDVSTQMLIQSINPITDNVSACLHFIRYICQQGTIVWGENIDEILKKYLIEFPQRFIL